MAHSNNVLQEVEVGDIVGPTVLADLIGEEVREDTGIFTLAGALHDHRIDEFARILRFARSDTKVAYKFRLEWPDELDEGSVRREESRLQDSFLRAGLVEHANSDRVIERLRQYDDVIVGVDTNILWDCTLTSQLLPRIYEEEFPNWILIAIPKLVMAETENGANNKIGGDDHPRQGWPTYKARLAQRGLQELMMLRQRDPDRPGLAVMTVGELSREHDEVDQHNWKLDSQIRSQFQRFLADISFHKGTFFLSQDRVNVMMSGTEGADGLYLQKPRISEFNEGEFTDANFTALLYELAVQFGGVRLRSTGDRDLGMCLDVFWPGKQVSDWRRSRLKVSELQRG